MYYVQDAHSFWDWIYFVLLIVVSSKNASINRVYSITSLPRYRGFYFYTSGRLTDEPSAFSVTFYLSKTIRNKNEGKNKLLTQMCYVATM